MSGRRVQPTSGRTYHIEYNPPKIEGKDDITGEALIQRDDDAEAIVKDRLHVYHEQTRPLIDYYSNLAKHDASLKYIRVDGTQDIGVVQESIMAQLA